MIYLLVFCISVTIIYSSQRIKGFGGTSIFIVGISPLVILAGFRDVAIGTDTSSYPLYVFDAAKMSKDLLTSLKLYTKIESGYRVLAYISSCIDNSINSFLTSTHFVILYVLSIAYKRFRLNTALAFTFFCLIFYSTSLNLARQYLAIPFCVWSLAEFSNKKYRYTIILLICAFFFHQSSLIFIAVIALYHLCMHNFRRMKKRSSYFFIVGGTIIVILFFHFLLELAVNLGVSRVEYLSRYGDSEQYGTNIPLSLFAINTFNLLLFFIATQKIHTHPFLIFSKYILLISLLLCFTGLISKFAVRTVDYFMMVGIVCIVYYLKKIKYHFVWVFISFYLFYWFNPKF